MNTNRCGTPVRSFWRRFRAEISAMCQKTKDSVFTKDPLLGARAPPKGPAGGSWARGGPEGSQGGKSCQILPRLSGHPQILPRKMCIPCRESATFQGGKYFCSPCSSEVFQNKVRFCTELSAKTLAERSSWRIWGIHWPAKLSESDGRVVKR